MPKYKYSQIQQLFKDKGCELLTPESDYKNLNTKVQWRCGKCPPENNLKQTSVRSFKKYGRCQQCGNRARKRAGPKKGTLIHSYSKVKSIFEENDCELLTQEENYKGAKSKVRWICKCQRNKKKPKVQVSSFSGFKLYKRCRSCGIKESKGNLGSYRDFCELLEKEGWEMVSPETEYHNTKTKMRVRTVEGHEWFTTYNRFHQGHRVFINDCGWINPMQIQEIFHKQQKSAYSLKEYTFPSGRKVWIQGYEPRCLDYLQKELGITEEDITVNHKEMPKIWYSFEGTRHRYYPDIFVKSQNLVIEVKSPYTYKNQESQNLAKFEATRKLYPFRVYIFGRKRLLETWHYSKNNLIKVYYSKKAKFPPNFDFEEKWGSHCVPYLANPKITGAVEAGIRKITGKTKLKRPLKAPVYYSSSDALLHYFDSLESKIIERDNLYIVYDPDEEDAFKEEDPECYAKQTERKTIILFEDFNEKYYGKNGELAFENRKDDIYYWIVPAQCHTWNPTFSLALARLVYPEKIWEVVKGPFHTTVVDKERTLCFDITYANLLQRRGDFPNPLEEALREN